ncbi:MAG: transposase [Caldilineaceae bacterium]
MEPDGHALVPFFVRELDYLLRRLDDLDQLLKMERNHLQNGQAMPDMPQVVLADIEQTIAALQQQREALAQTIKAHCKRHPQLQTLYRQLLGVPGIGLQSVLPLIVILYRFDALSAGAGGKKQLTAFLGLDSQIRQSGTSVSGVPRISKRGDTQMRARLYMCALGGVRGHNVLREFYRLLVARGKAKKVALVACARKILHWAWAIFQSGQDFDPALAATHVAPVQP